METARAANVLAARKMVAVEIARPVESPYCGDEGLLRQLILNLLDNAVKYTPAGGAVGVDLVRIGSSYEITVTDTGEGIPPEAQAHVFERFYRVDRARSRSEHANGSGAGLGLSIAKWIAEAHGGRLTLQHSDERGSTFVVALPISCQSSEWIR